MVGILDKLLGRQQSDQAGMPVLSEVILSESSLGGSVSTLHEVEGHDDLLGKRSNTGIHYHDAAALFPDKSELIMMGRKIIPIDPTEIVTKDTSGQIHIMSDVMRARLYDKNPPAYRAFVEGLVLHHIAQKIPEVRDHITPIHSMYLQEGDNGDYHIITIMEKILRNEGSPELARNVADIIEEMNTLDPAQRLTRSRNLLGQFRVMARVLDTLAAKVPGIKHRDIKPENFLLQNEGQKDERLILADFGITLFDDQTLGTQEMGSEFYVAPEQWGDSSLAIPQSDQFSLSLGLAEILGIYETFSRVAIPRRERAIIEQVEARGEDSRKCKRTSKWDIITGHEPYIGREEVAEELQSKLGIDLERAFAVANVLIKAGSRSPSRRYTTTEEMVIALESALGVSASKRKNTKQPSRLALEEVAR